MEERGELHIHHRLIVTIGGDRKTLAWAAHRFDALVFETAPIPGEPHRLVGDTRQRARDLRDQTAAQGAPLLAA